MVCGTRIKPYSSSAHELYKNDPQYRGIPAQPKQKEREMKRIQKSLFLLPDEEQEYLQAFPRQNS